MNWKQFGLNFLQRYAADLLLSYLSGQLQQLPADRLQRWLVNVGIAFGPANIRHFSQLSPDEQEELLARVPVLNLKHEDWLQPFEWVPRRWTTWLGPGPTLSDLLTGQITETNLAVDGNGTLLPIPKNGDWYVIRGYLASTSHDGVHNRLGWRFDNVDNYWSLSVSLKKVN